MQTFKCGERRACKRRAWWRHGVTDLREPRKRTCAGLPCWGPFVGGHCSSRGAPQPEHGRVLTRRAACRGTRGAWRRRCRRLQRMTRRPARRAPPPRRPVRLRAKRPPASTAAPTGTRSRRETPPRPRPRVAARLPPGRRRPNPGRLKRSLTWALQLRCRQRCHAACVRVAFMRLRASAVRRCARRCGSVVAADMQPHHSAGPRLPGARITPPVGARRLTRNAPPAPPAPQDCPQPRDAEAVRAAQQAFWNARRARGGGGAAGTGTPKRCGGPGAAWGDPAACALHARGPGHARCARALACLATPLAVRVAFGLVKCTGMLARTPARRSGRALCTRVVASTGSGHPASRHAFSG